MTVNLNDQLIPGSSGHTLNHLIDRLELSAFDAAFRDDKKGAPAYSPAVTLKIIFYCYSRGIITRAPIEYACKTNIIVKALARDAEPDHDTVAHFISSQAEAGKDLFAQALLKCHALGLTGGELFAIDGREPPSNAAKEWPGALEELEKKKKGLEALMGKIIERHIQFDKQAAGEKDLSGAAFSYVYDKEYQDKHLERIKKKLKYIDTFLETAEERKGAGGEEVKSNITDNESAKIKGAHGYIRDITG
jgi:transposase